MCNKDVRCAVKLGLMKTELTINSWPWSGRRVFVDGLLDVIYKADYKQSLADYTQSANGYQFASPVRF